MIKNLYILWFSPRGRIGRRAFIIGAALWLGFYIAQQFWFAKTGVNGFNFWLSLILLFVNLHIILCVAGKRLHDMGRGYWPIVGMFALLFMASILVMLNFGGLEYFNALMENPEIAEDPEAMQALHKTYQLTLADGVPKIRLLLSIIPLAFSLWLALAKGEDGGNRYGPAPQPNI